MSGQPNRLWEVRLCQSGSGENGGKVELQVFVRREAGAWKIYRVRDVTDNYEHPIFNAGAIARAKVAAESGL